MGVCEREREGGRERMCVCVSWVVSRSGNWPRCWVWRGTDEVRGTRMGGLGGFETFASVRRGVAGWWGSWRLYVCDDGSKGRFRCKGR